MIPRSTFCALLLLGACSQEHASSPATAVEVAVATAPHLPIAIDSTRIAHLLDLGSGIYSGAMPSGPQAFAELAALGIKTIVNVDSARPAVELAAAAGLVYVHIPFGYDGIPSEAALAFERVIRESARPIYFHCHHGKHRGPAAAALALRVATGCGAEAAQAVLTAAGTSEDYKGLWRDVAAWEPAAKGTLLPELMSIAKVADFPASMAKIDRIWDNLKLIRAAQWQTPADHPDLSLQQETLILSQQLHDSASMLAAELQEDREFEHRLEEATELADTLHQASRAGNAELLETHYLDLAASCKNCHRDYRNE